MRVRATVCLTALALLLPGAATATAPTRSLSGDYTGSAGNRVVLTHSGTSIEWVSTSGSGAWVHDFTGTLIGDVIDGTFQDRPGYSVHNHGRITAKVLDNCRFQITSVQIGDGAPGPGGETFRRDGSCTAADPQPMRLSTPKRFRAKGDSERYGDRIWATIAGRFKADPDGAIPDEDHARGTMSVSFRWEYGRRVERDHWKVALHGPGNFRITKDFLMVRLVAEIVDTTDAERRHRCVSDPFGTVTLLRRRDRDAAYSASIHVQGLCGQHFSVLGQGSITDE